MRLVFIRILDKALIQHPSVNPTLFVDDLAADIIAKKDHIVAELGGFIEIVAKFIHDTGQELSSTKSVCTASSTELGKLLSEKWAKLNITFQRKVKSLGVGMGAGVRRNVDVQKKRLIRTAKESLASGC